MKLDKEKLKKEGLSEAGYIGEELIALSGITELEQKCIVAEKAIKEDYFTREEAFEAYGITEEEYQDYLKRRRISN